MTGLHLILRTTLAAVLVALMAMPAAAVGTEVDCKAAEDDQTALTQLMCPLGKHFKKLMRGYRKPDQYEDLAGRVVEMRDLVERAAELTPLDVAEESDEAERETAQAAYTDVMKEMAAQLEKLEAALRAGEKDDVKTLVKSIKRAKKTGHDDFNSRGEF